MGIMDTGVEALTLTKAIVEVIDFTTKTKGRDNPISPCIGRTNDLLAVSEKYEMKKGKIALQQEASKLKQVTGLGLGDSTELQFFNDSIKEFEPDVTIRRFEVQFNPSTLSLSGSGGGMVQLTNYSAMGKEDAGVSYSAASTNISMSVQLVFDETNNFTAFPGDITGFNVSNVSDAIVNTVADQIKKRPSVQTEVEGFLGAIRSKYTRSVAFCWGKMLYFGCVNRVNTRYTLFNPSGKPVRATVDLSIVCADPSLSEGYLGYWEEKYENFFKEDMSLSGAKNSLVNLSNFSR